MRRYLLFQQVCELFTGRSRPYLLKILWNFEQTIKCFEIHKILSNYSRPCKRAINYRVQIKKRNHEITQDVAQPLGLRHVSEFRSNSATFRRNSATLHRRILKFFKEIFKATKFAFGEFSCSQPSVANPKSFLRKLFPKLSIACKNFLVL